MKSRKKSFFFVSEDSEFGESSFWGLILGDKQPLVKKPFFHFMIILDQSKITIPGRKREPFPALLVESGFGITPTFLKEGFELAIIQHTNCGYERLADPKLQKVLSDKLGIDEAEIGALANVDHTKSIREDIERLRRSSLVPNELVVSGHIYNVDDGVVREVVAPTPLIRDGR